MDRGGMVRKLNDYLLTYNLDYTDEEKIYFCRSCECYGIVFLL